MRTGNFTVVLFGLLLGLCSLTQGQSQSTDSEKCPDPVFGGMEVAQRAKIIEYADTSVLTRVATEHKFHGTIRADAVLCRNGHVTDIKVTTQSLPQNLDTFVIAAISTTRFKPAELYWHSVSQRIGFEFSINDDIPSDRLDPSQAEDRLLEHLEIMGNRTVSNNQIKALLKVRLGEPFHTEKMQNDLQSILATGFFEPKQTRAYIEWGTRGGVGVVFEVVERPFIKEIDFAGIPLDTTAASEGMKTLKALGIETGKRYSDESMNQAVETLMLSLQKLGVPVGKTYLQTTLVDAMTINLKFVMSK